MVMLKFCLNVFLITLISTTNAEGQSEIGEGPLHRHNPCTHIGLEAPMSLVSKWTTYKDEKCIFVFKRVLKTYHEAKAACNGIEAGLVSIDSPDKQAFLEKFFKLHGVVNKVWIGLEYKNGAYEWADESSFGYSNWASGSPKRSYNYCVQMHPNPVGGYGKWADVDCSKQNTVACEDNLPWSLKRLQNMVINNRRNPVPLGFVYVQLPQEKSPKEIWPWMVWDDISHNYSGVFFRVVGGNAGSFGSVQESDSPRITSIHYEKMDIKHKGQEARDLNLRADGQRSKMLYTGDEICNYQCHMSGLVFVQSKAEVRPRNMAIRIWKRRY